jgi:hypothetical protein
MRVKAGVQIGSFDSRFKRLPPDLAKSPSLTLLEVKVISTLVERRDYSIT